MTDRDIINKEVRGITTKTILCFIGGIVSVIMTVMGTYFSIIRKMDTIQVIQNSVNAIDIRVDKNSNDIKEIKQTTLPSMDTRISVIEEEMKDNIFLKNSR